MTEQMIEKGINDYISHLHETANVFNGYAKKIGLPIEIDPTNIITAVRTGVGLEAISSFWTREDDNGIVHETQIKTALDCVQELHTNAAKCGHVVGAMQSGKTTTSLALQWAGPILYLIEDKKPVYPFYIIGNQTSHEDQTSRELFHFLTYYGDLELKLVPTAKVSRHEIDPMFRRAPTLKIYRTNVLRNAFKETLDVPRLDQDLLHRRVGGQKSIKQIAELSQRATNGGYRPLMIIDEPQYGASDRVVQTESGTEQRECVLTKILNRIELELKSTREDHWFIGLSATPFELNDLSRLWEVRQTLTPAYSGFNYFNGLPISPEVDVTPPTVFSLTKFSEEIGVPFMRGISMAAYDLDKISAFIAHSKKINFKENHDAYRRAVEDALREAIYAAAIRYGGGKSIMGMCIRAFNNNTKTDSLIDKLALDPKKIEVIRYYGGDMSRVSVKRAIAQRKHKDLPYVMFVTNRARMADAFPVEVHFFMDFAKMASDLNALLQGLLGRACGYGKKSTVVLSDANAAIVAAYVVTKGEYVHKPSRHAIVVGGYRRGAPTWMIKLRVEMDDPVVQDFFRQIDERMVKANVKQQTPRLRTGRSKKGGYRTGPVLSIAENLGLFEHIENPAVKNTIFPEIPMDIHIARRDDSVPYGNDSSTPLHYSCDENGDCRYTFRWQERKEGARGGAPGRAKGKKDSQQHMEPTIYVEKYDPETGNSINDKRSSNQKNGDWRAFMITFPLKEPIRELQVGDGALPISASAYNYLLTEQEQIDRDAQEAKNKE